MADDLATLTRHLRNRREMIDRGNGDVQDIPDEDCQQAADALERLTADLRVKQIVADEAMAQGERQGAEIEELRAALHVLAGPPENGEHETAVPNDSPVTIRCQLGDLRRAHSALSQSPADLLARREAERAMLAGISEQHLREVLGPGDLRPKDRLRALLARVEMSDALAALAEQEAKGDAS